MRQREIQALERHVQTVPEDLALLRGEPEFEKLYPTTPDGP